jgi:fumarate hydratase subunit alpha
MRELNVSEIIPAVKKLCMEANYNLGEDVYDGLKNAMNTEESPLGKSILQDIVKNAEIAREDQVPICQDTGLAVLFVRMGQDLHIVGGDFSEAINQGVREGYKDGYLRKSIVTDPIERKNSGDNTPAIINLEIVPGDKLEIVCAPKGGGSENMSEVKMLKPSDGVEGIKDFVVDRVARSGGNPCPPVIVGVGIGGTFDKCAQLAKKALLREVGTKHPDPYYAKLEEELLTLVNKVGIGPQGLGGRTTALAVQIEVHPCHIASFPVAVNMQCHAARHKSIVL